MNDTDPRQDQTTAASLEREALNLETAGRSAPRGARAFCGSPSWWPLPWPSVCC
ncbi:hypothetical protein [Neopusillimonas aromaticivorans]|uniref:hypothetical protein n=1 Tax=Neopusillimonas aromaticivorans TaxID=2979868 RepID=UPI00259933EF|nr:hypothetical protein [Neopusillimonas aromaticivorans]WJJ94386.1 hypothetical protein N7E01_05120 [Neopusillimonas aromaticivorans]